MVDAEVSGVMFTCNPLSGDPSIVAVNASWGLGLAVVGGEVTPDDYLLSKVTGEIVRAQVGDKRVEYVPDPDGHGAVGIEVSAERASARCLDDDGLQSLLAMAKRDRAPLRLTPGHRMGARPRRATRPTTSTSSSPAP